MTTKKGRKPRGIKLSGRPSQNMCTCLSFQCDPMGMSPMFQAKIERNRENGGCPSCGGNPCKCKSTMSKKRDMDIVKEYDNRYARHFK